MTLARRVGSTCSPWPTTARRLALATAAAKDQTAKAGQVLAANLGTVTGGAPARPATVRASSGVTERFRTT
ncbi:hypothetical protein NKG94_14275 [Micromonospora sp. M12]